MTQPSTRRAIAALLVVTIIWGWTFSWMKAAIDAAEVAIGPDALPLVIGVFMSTRFVLAAVVLPLFLPAARRGLRDLGVWVDGGWLAALMLVGFLLQMFGLDGVSPAVSAFLTSLYVVFTALWIAVVRRVALGGMVLIGVAVVTAGTATISGPPQLTFDLPEWLTVLCAVVFAAHILVTDVVTKRRPPVALTVACFAWVALGSLGTMAVGLALRPDLGLDAVRTLLQTGDFLRPALLAGVLGTAVALTLLNTFQRFVTPVRAAIIYALEPVWAAIISVSIGLTLIDDWLLFGGCALLAGNLLVELGPRWRARSERIGRRSTGEEKDLV
jgi:drug/metabolite transporter (DMT)-like permease